MCVTKEMEIRALILLHEAQMALNGDPADLAAQAEDLKIRLGDLLNGDLAQAMATLTAQSPSYPLA
jgi:hypothetical protein